ncbi:cysteine-rich receptor-like protein kinase 28 [Coffea eugenioides]|uniref:cysteine-rich receptor-like protein kinase 28 n=1 Tax=Coffea eugenioides TaxID=49369 RepID=UPI000F608FCE|nr:cysteine-rich receptor-like protein kinase 28 [Coffea eugenioides]
METFSRMKPSDEMFSEDLSLKSWIEKSLPTATIHVTDANLLKQQDEHFNGKLECVSMIFNLALSCCTECPQDRMNMKDVLAALKKIKRQLDTLSDTSARKHEVISSNSLSLEPTIWILLKGVLGLSSEYHVFVLKALAEKFVWRLQLLGTGGFGSVYCGTLNDGRKVAVKVFHVQLERALESLDTECESFIAKLLSQEDGITHTATIATFGYVAPEYGLEGLVSTKCDVYSYGIMLMEVFTRTKPNDARFNGNSSLKDLVQSSMPNALYQIIDTNLLQKDEEHFAEKLDCISFILEIALNCSRESSRERSNMETVLREMNNINYKLLSIDRMH